MKKPFVITLLFVLLAIDPAGGQAESMLPETWGNQADDRRAEQEFMFVRAKYTNYPGSGGPGYGYGGLRR